MSDDIFSAAGKEFRDANARQFSAKDQGLARLAEIAQLAESGVKAFYDAAGRANPDVTVERPVETQLRIVFGVRVTPDSKREIQGPFASVAVMPDGSLALGADARWGCPGPYNGTLVAKPLTQNDWQDAVSRWLVQFLVESERTFKQQF